MQLLIEIDDDLLAQLKLRAQENSLSLDEFVRRALSDWFSTASTPADVKKRIYQEKTFNMGQSYSDVSKALHLAAELEDEAIIQKLRDGKQNSRWRRWETPGRLSLGDLEVCSGRLNGCSTLIYSVLNS